MFSKLFGTDSFMELLGTPSFWYTMVILVGIIILLVASIKHWSKGGKWILLGLFGVIYTGLTIWSGININQYYSASGGIYGAITGIFDTNEVEVVSSMEFKLSNIELTQVGDSDTYSANIVMNDVFALDKDVEYMVFVNDMPCTFVQNASDYVLADYRYAFYNDNFEIILDDTLNFRFAFYTNSTSLRVTTNGGSEALKYWHHYFNKNTFVVKIAEVKSLDDYFVTFSNGDISNYCVVTYMFNNDVEYVQVYKKGQNLVLPDCDNENYNIWTLNGEQIDSDYVLKENVIILGELKLYEVIFRDTYEEYSKIQVAGPYLSMSIENPQVDGAKFMGWSIDGVTIIKDIYSYKITSDITFYALYCKEEYNFVYFTIQNNSNSVIRVVDFNINIYVQPNEVITYGCYSGSVAIGTEYKLNYTLSDGLKLYDISDSSISFSLLDSISVQQVSVVLFD